MTETPVFVAGAGLSGSVLARQLAEAGYSVQVFESRDHVAGNCHTYRDADTGVLVHAYGPHIFHTGDATVWDYVNRFATFREYHHKVWTTYKGEVFPMPITLSTINQFFGTDMTPAEAEAFVKSKAEDIQAPANFEEQALAMIGRELYEAFFLGYTEKQWGLSPRALPASILKRLPLRFTDEGGYFSHPYQGMPDDGYTPMVEAMLDHRNINVQLSTPFDGDVAGHVFWTGPLDAYFGHRLGWLGYRTLDFAVERHSGAFQDCPVMNYADRDVPITRITEHKHFAPWESHDRTVITRETSRACGADDIPYYPIRLAQDKGLLSDYIAAARQLRGVTFVGRLGTYRYLDMDVCIREALDAADAFIALDRDGGDVPAFFAEPL